MWKSVLQQKQLSRNVCRKRIESGSPSSRRDQTDATQSTAILKQHHPLLVSTVHAQGPTTPRAHDMHVARAHHHFLPHTPPLQTVAEQQNDGPRERTLAERVSPHRGDETGPAARAIELRIVPLSPTPDPQGPPLLCTSSISLAGTWKSTWNLELSIGLLI